MSIQTALPIHPDTRITSLTLTVASLASQIDFYRQALGFQLRRKKGKRAFLGSADHDLLELVESPTASRYRRVTGLYHFAVLFPDRRELARAVARLYSLQVPNSPTDHIMTKSTYLDDLEGNGIELYCESPQDGTWSWQNGEYITRRADGSLSSGREPLDVEALFSHLREDDRLDQPIPADTRIGHVHLHVRDLGEAVDFYHGLLGFDLMGLAEPNGMAFISAGGYHHHIGLNTWQGRGASPPPADALGLRYFVVALPDQKSLSQVLSRLEDAAIPIKEGETGYLIHDPSRNGVLLAVR